MAGARREDLMMKIPALVHLARLGYAYLPRKDIYRDEGTNILPGSLQAALGRINGREISPEEMHSLMQELRSALGTPDLGEKFYRIVRDGWQGRKLIDFEHPEENTFQAAAELRCKCPSGSFRPDIVLFVNGLPLGMIEVKTREQARGIRAEYDRMCARIRKEEFRPFLQAAQVWAFSNDRPYDPERLLPEDGVFYATAAWTDFPLHPFREMHPGASRGLPPLNPEEERIIRADNGAEDPCGSRKLRREQSPRTPTHRMLTGLFSPRRFLFLLCYGIQFERTAEGGETRLRKRILDCEQLFLLAEVKRKAGRGFRNWKIPRTGAAGETALKASLIHLLRDLYAGGRVYWILSGRKYLLKMDAELQTCGLSSGRRGMPEKGEVVLMEPPEDPLKWLQEKAERNFGGRRVFLAAEPLTGAAGKGLRGRIAKADPKAVLIGTPPENRSEGGNYTYLLECADGTLYCGWTNDLEKRVRDHNQGRGAKYTRSRRPVRLVYFEEFDSREEAMSREWHLKKLSRAGKECLIAGAGAPDGKKKPT